MLLLVLISVKTKVIFFKAGKVCLARHLLPFATLIIGPKSDMAASRKKYSLRNRVALLRSGERYFEVLLRMIADARQEFHLQTYILEPDTTGRLVLEALIAAAARGSPFTSSWMHTVQESWMTPCCRTFEVKASASGNTVGSFPGESCTWGAGCITRSRSWTTIPRSWAGSISPTITAVGTANRPGSIMPWSYRAKPPASSIAFAGNAGKTRIRSMNFLPASRIDCRSRDCQPTTAFPSGSHRTTSCAVSRKRRLRTGRRSDKHGTALCSSAATSCPAGLPDDS